MVPTPGQAEQEYLGKHLSSGNLAPSMDQHNFSLEKAFSFSASFQYIFPGTDTNYFKKAVGEFIASRFSL